VIAPLKRRLRITLGTYDPAEALAQAKDLVAVLRMPGLPAPVTLLREENVAAKP